MISPTAKIVAYWRTLSDIPFAREVSDAVHAEETALQMLGGAIELSRQFSPSAIEARYKSINVGIERVHATNVLELAYGLSPRCLSLASTGSTYVATDLPGLLAESRPIMEGLARDLPLAGRLHFEPVNVLERDQLESAAAHFKGSRFVVCNEGLLMYLSKEEKARMAENIRALLLGSGGAWITTDLEFTQIRGIMFAHLKPEVKQRFIDLMSSLSSQVGRDLPSYEFANSGEAQQFYEDLGFQIEKFPFYDGSYTLSTLPAIAKDMKEPMLNALSTLSAWILTPRK
jgi:O-methyltransferase involved in polyketide biosynthesis